MKLIKRLFLIAAGLYGLMVLIGFIDLLIRSPEQRAADERKAAVEQAARRKTKAASTSVP
jgi:hypothetical protein